MLPANLNDVTKEAIALAVPRGWMLDRGDSVRLTDVGRDLVKNRSAPAFMWQCKSIQVPKAMRQSKAVPPSI